MEIGPEEEFARAGPLQRVGLGCGWSGSCGGGGGGQGQKERAGKGCESGCVCVEGGLQDGRV